jgi:hypothetical protein
MSKISDKGASHHPGRFSVRWCRYYDQIPRVADDRHPVDLAVDKCLGDSVTRARIVHLQQRVLSTLGAESGVYLELESTVNERQREREKCFFDLGYEHGATEIHAQTKLGSLRLSRESEAFGNELRGRIVRANIPSIETLLVLLECIWRMVATQREE